jgi:hypothetical protein
MATTPTTWLVGIVRMIIPLNQDAGLRLRNICYKLIYQCHT